jgi:hypothetical protein
MTMEVSRYLQKKLPEFGQNLKMRNYNFAALNFSSTK